MNITFINDNLGYGGAEKVLITVAKGLKVKGHNISIINLNTSHRGVHYDLSGIRIITANLHYGKGIKVNFNYARFTIRAARLLKSDVLIGFKTFSNFCASVSGKVLGIPSIISERADPYVEFKKIRLLTRFKLFCINHATGAVFQTNGARGFYSRHLQRSSMVIPNPILIEKEIPIINYDIRPKTIVSMGRLENKQKRLDIMIKAFAIFHSNYPDYSLHIYGNGEDEQLLLKLISDFNLQNSVKLLGVSKNSLNDLSKEGIFIITSDYEGISNSLLEAMSVGLPVVSTDHSPGGARLLITDHENGLLVSMGNAEAVAAALGEYAKNHDLIKKCGQNAKKVLERFNVRKIIDEWNSYIQHIVQNY